MNRILFIILVVVACVAAQGQVITQMAKDNMKIEKGVKPGTDEGSVTRREVDVQLDTTAAYYKYIDSAQVRIKQQDWAAAENFIRQAIAAEPSNNTNSMLLSNLATLQRFQGKLDEAIKNYTLALDMTPNAVTLLLNRAAVLMQTGKIEAAVADFEKVRSLDENEEESRYTLGMMAMDQGDYAKAEALFDEIKKHNSKSVLAWEGLGMLYKEQGDYAKATVHLSEAVKIDPTPTLLGNRADCYLVLKQLANASEDIQNALQLDPDDGFLYLLRAKLNKMRFNYSDMNRDIKLAIEHGVDKEIANALKN
ncbi:MAG: tetratricopeptide repeat protein [Muribaculaceae bacterium]|nr:tetratricopeptide repeat protein [Muribaculaceae bacterium]